MMRILTEPLNLPYHNRLLKKVLSDRIGSGPGECPQNADSMADGAVNCEPVSASNSLIYRENTGKFFDFRPDLMPGPSETAAAIAAFSLNSLESRAGNYF
jgi:hypothetical protein